MLCDEQVEAQLEARQVRQRLLRERQNTAFSFVLDEHLFLRRMGGIDVTRGLIDHVLALGALRNIEIQLMPLVREVHAGLDGPMQLLETPEPSLPMTPWACWSDCEERCEHPRTGLVQEQLQRR